MERYIFIMILCLAALILCVQIITEIIKALVQDKTKYNIIVFIVSLILTVATVIAASEIVPFGLTWYIVAAAIASSFFVAYGAMFGYDKLFKRVFAALKEAIDSYKKIKEDSEDEKIVK